MKKALITGITGMDGSHMADLLLSKGYEVYGLKRHSSTDSTENIKHIIDDITLISGDLLDFGSLVEAIRESGPDEVYNFAAQSFVKESWDAPLYTANVNGVGVLNLLESIKQSNLPVRFYQASTAEMYGVPDSVPQNEITRFNPVNPYAAAKTFAHYMTQMYRVAYDMYNVCGIAHAHESERRSLHFVSRKVSYNVAKIYHGVSDGFSLGQLGAIRDYSYAPDYMKAIWLTLQQDEPDDYVISAGAPHSIEEFVIAAFKVIGVDDYKKYVKFDPSLCRPIDVPILHGDSSKIYALGWHPTMDFYGLVNHMVESDKGLVKEQYNL